MEVPDGFPRLDKATRPWECKREDADCTRTAPCPSCRGARNRRKGLRKQREARKALERIAGIPAGRYATQTGNEENWRLPTRVEVKSGAQVKPIWTRYLKAEVQSESSRPVGDTRPFVMVAQADSDGLVVVRTSKLAALLDALGGS